MRRSRAALVAPALMVVSGGSMYVGASVGVLLFAQLPPAAVAWLRVAASAAVLVALVRPARAAWRGRRLARAALFGTVTALMNLCFYEAIARLPLGAVVAIEFLGPIAVVAAGSRSVRAAAALFLALGGVWLIADVQWSAEPVGLAFALGAAALWAGYVVLGKTVAERGGATSTLAVGWVAAAVVTSPLLASLVGHDLSTLPLGRVAVGVVVLAVLSSVVPYVLDQRILRSVGRARFALLLALLPVAAVAAGAVVLGQVPTASELLGIVAVVGALLVSDHDRGEATPLSRPRGSAR